MTPEENFNFVNAYNGRLGPIIQVASRTWLSISRRSAAECVFFLEISRRLGFESPRNVFILCGFRE
jgi:hypothetical protein